MRTCHLLPSGFIFDEFLLPPPWRTIWCVGGNYSAILQNLSRTQSGALGDVVQAAQLVHGHAILLGNDIEGLALSHLMHLRSGACLYLSLSLFLESTTFILLLLGCQLSCLLGDISSSPPTISWAARILPRPLEWNI